MSYQLTCSICRWFHPSKTQQGRCQKSAPICIYVSVDGGFSETKWPTVLEDDWCGSFELAAECVDMATPKEAKS